MITRARTVTTVTTTLLAVSLLAAGCSSDGAAATPDAPEASGTATDLDPAWQAARDLLPDDLASSGTITAAVSTAYAPHSFLKEGTTEFVGYEIEIFDDVAEILGLEVEYSEAPFQQLVAGVASGRSDVAFGNLGDNDLRQAEVDFVDHLNLTFQLAVAKGNPQGVENIYDLCGAELGTVQGTTSIINAALAKCESEGKPAPTYTEFPDQGAKDQAIAAGRLPVADIKSTPIARYLDAEGLSPEVEYIDAPEVGNLYEGIITKKGNDELTGALTAALEILFEDGRHQAILEKWDVGDLDIPAPGVNIGSEASNWVQVKS